MSDSNSPIFPNLLPHSGVLSYLPAFLSFREADHMMELLSKEVDWQQYEIKIFGKSVLQPRLSAWYGEKRYAYSGKLLMPRAWTPELLLLKHRVEKASGEIFNSVLLNLYRDGRDSMGWHRDNEKELGTDPAIASVSLGAEREFQLRNYKNKKERVVVTLQHGSLLLMSGESQNYWEHSLPKRAGIDSSRINLTFRNIL